MSNVMEEVIDQTSEDDIWCAWNGMTEKEGDEPVQEHDILGGSYTEMFTEEILGAILFSEQDRDNVQTTTSGRIICQQTMC